MRLPILALVCLYAAPAAAEPGLLRISSVIPDGTGWARELRAFAREVETASAGRLRLKFYFGGIAGDELAAEDRMRRDQLDGVVSAGILCEKLAPSMRVLRVPGLFQNRDESSYAIGRLRPSIDQELTAAGYVNLGEAGVGPAILFTRTPIRKFDDLKSGKYWVWDVDEMARTVTPALGLHVVPMPIADARRGYEQGQHDGFVSPASAALGFQWSAVTRYYTDLRVSYITGCLIVAHRAFDLLPIDVREVLRAASAKVQVRMNDLGEHTDAQLLGGLFQKQGLIPMPVSDAFRAEFFEAARAVRAQLSKQLVAPALIDKVTAMLADYRAEHH